MTVLLHCHSHSILGFDRLCREYLVSRHIPMPERIDSEIINKRINDTVEAHREYVLSVGDDTIKFVSETATLGDYK